MWRVSMKMYWTEDINEAFQPLIDHIEGVPESIKDSILGSFMYMGHDDKDVFCYKNKTTRVCMNIKKGGERL